MSFSISESRSKRPSFLDDSSDSESSETEEQRLEREEEEERQERLLSEHFGEAAEAPSDRRTTTSTTTDQDIAAEYATTTEPKKKKPRVKLTLSQVISSHGLIQVRSEFGRKLPKFNKKTATTTATAAKYSSSLVDSYKAWCFDLFPGLNFTDTLTRIESFGGKKEMKDYLTHMREEIRNNHLEKLFGKEVSSRMLQELEEGIRRQQQQDEEGYHHDEEKENYNARLQVTTRSSSSSRRVTAADMAASNEHDNENTGAATPEGAVESTNVNGAPTSPSSSSTTTAPSPPAAAEAPETEEQEATFDDDDDDLQDTDDELEVVGATNKRLKKTTTTATATTTSARRRMGAILEDTDDEQEEEDKEESTQGQVDSIEQGMSTFTDTEMVVVEKGQDVELVASGTEEATLMDTEMAVPGGPPESQEEDDSELQDRDPLASQDEDGPETEGNSFNDTEMAVLDAPTGPSASQEDGPETETNFNDTEMAVVQVQPDPTASKEDSNESPSSNAGAIAGLQGVSSPVDAYKTGETTPVSASRTGPSPDASTKASLFTSETPASDRVSPNKDVRLGQDTPDHGANTPFSGELQTQASEASTLIPSATQAVNSDEEDEEEEATLIPSTMNTQLESLSGEYEDEISRGQEE